MFEVGGWLPAWQSQKANTYVEELLYNIRERERKNMKILIDNHPGIGPKSVRCENKGESFAVIVYWMKSGNCSLLIRLP